MNYHASITAVQRDTAGLPEPTGFEAKSGLRGGAWRGSCAPIISAKALNAGLAHQTGVTVYLGTGDKPTCRVPATTPAASAAGGFSPLSGGVTGLVHRVAARFIAQSHVSHLPSAAQRTIYPNLALSGMAAGSSDRLARCRIALTLQAALDLHRRAA